MGNKKFTEKDFFDSMFYASFLICLLIAAYVYFEDEVNQRNYHLINKSIYSNLDDKGRSIFGGINFTSTVFGAQNNITASFMVRPSVEYMSLYPDESKNIKQIYVYLPAASTGYEKFVNGVSFSPIITLQRDPVREGYFSGTFNIMYQEEGDKCVRFSLELLNGEPNRCQPNEEPMIHITSIDSTLQYKNNKLIAALTWVLIAFSVVSARDPLQKMLSKRRNGQ